MMKFIGSRPGGPEISPQSGSPSDYEPDYGKKHYDPDLVHPNTDFDHDLLLECPPHTTQRKLITKIDFRVVPVLSILYLLAFLDRTNIANASVFGLQQDLKLTGTQYNTALTVSTKANASDLYEVQVN